jgi:hypothetical protein
MKKFESLKGRVDWYKPGVITLMVKYYYAQKVNPLEEVRNDKINMLLKDKLFQVD